MSANEQLLMRIKPTTTIDLFLSIATDHLSGTRETLCTDLDASAAGDEMTRRRDTERRDVKVNEANSLKLLDYS